jgi:uncharacterized protein (TIGR03437 family)
MKRIIPGFTVILVFLTTVSTLTYLQSDRVSGQQRPQTLDDFDIRAGLEKSAEKSAKTLNLYTQTRWSSLTAAPSRIVGFGQALSSQSTEAPEVVSKRFLKRHPELFRLSAQEVDELNVSKIHRSRHNGATHLTLQQRVNGIEIFQGEFSIHLNRRGEIVAVDGELIPDASRTVNLTRPAVSSVESLRKAGEYAGASITAIPGFRSPPRGVEQSQLIDVGGVFVRDVETRLVYFPLSSNQLRLAWEFTLWMRETPDVYLILVDADRGSLLYRYNLTWHCFNEVWGGPEKSGKIRKSLEADGIKTVPNLFGLLQTPHGLVYLKDSPRPNTPHINDAPPTVERQDVEFRATPYNGSTIFNSNDPHYDWWAGQSPNELVGNNVDAHLDRNGDDRPDSPRLSVAGGDFSFPIDLTNSPTTEDNQKSALVNLFYWVNRCHDILYLFGFNEASGNFQKNNFNLGGQGNDLIQADAQDGSGTNNANYSGGRDGSPARIQMYLWTGNPQLDGDLDQSIILHELAHGLSTRLVGNGTGLTGTQGRGMGEGWSDYFALTLQRDPGDDLDGKYAIGQYAYNNYARGIRRFPYSVETGVYPLNFGDIRKNTEIHAVGEIWCNTLLEMRALLIRKYGFQEGQRQSLQLVVDGLKLTPVSPTFLDARNAIILADRVNNDGANQCLIWQAFSKRGMGFSANTLDANDGSPIEEFDAPPFCNDVGVIRFDKKNYLLGETMKVSVGDRNATDPVRARVRSSNTGDEEMITLAQDAVFAGNFIANLRIVTGRAAHGDGALQASLQARDKIIVTYEDANDGGGNPAQSVAQIDVAGEKIIFEDNVELGNRGWSSSLTPASNWVITNARSATPSHCWTDSLSGNYVNNSDVWLVSPLLNLSQAAGVTLIFAQSYDFERDFDYGIVEFSIDDGSTWKRAAAFTGVQSNFMQTKISLDAAAGQSRARIRFRLRSDAATTADGWNIDDIRVVARTSDLGLLPPQSDFAPMITAVAPAFGPPTGNTPVIISGMNFTETDDLKVYFDGIAAANVKVSSVSTLTAATPPHQPDAVSVRIETRNGAATLSNAFTYFAGGGSIPTPDLINIFPTSGSTRGGAVVTLYGTNFTPETTVSFGSQSANVTFINSNALRAIAPPSIDNSASAVDVTTSNSPSQQSRIANGFNYVPPTPPAVQLISPNGGESFYTGAMITIRWQSSDNRKIAKHRISLYRSQGSNNEFVSNVSDEVSGDSRSFNWKIPAPVSPTNVARIQIVAIDDEGTEAAAFSSGDFTIDHRWRALTNMTGPVQRAAVASDGKYIYVFGGRITNNSSSTTSIVQRYDPAANPPLWTTDSVPPMPKGLNASEAVYIDGRIYIPGGINSSVEIEHCHYVYDPLANSWSSQVAPPTAVFLYSLAADAQRGVYYLTGGSDNQAAVSKVQVYDAPTNTWRESPPMTTARYAHEAAVVNGKLYVVGGSGPAGGLTSGEVFDFTTQKWSPIADLSRPRQYAINAIGQDELGRLFWLIIGGEDANTGAPLDSIEAYDVANDRWLLLDGSFNLPMARTRLGSAVFDGSIHALGGAVLLLGSTTSTFAHERFKPAGFRLVTPNYPPVVVAPSVPQIAIPGREMKFSVSAEDFGSPAPITISASGLPDGAIFDSFNETNNSVRGLFKWTPGVSDTGRSFSINFTAGDGNLTDTKSVIVRVVSANQLTAVNAADFRIGPLAADSIGAAFGANLAVNIGSARSFPLPLSIADTTLTIDGVPAPLFFASPNQINFLIPSSIGLGAATIIASNPRGEYSVGDIEITATAPAIFTINAAGTGDAAAIATVDGVNYQAPPFDLMVGGKPNILVLYGTGFRRAMADNPTDDNGVAESVSVSIDGRPAKVYYAGAQGGFSGLDQINVELPSNLAGQGLRRVEVVATVNGVTANRVTIQIK